MLLHTNKILASLNYLQEYVYTLINFLHVFYLCTLKLKGNKLTITYSTLQ